MTVFQVPPFITADSKYEDEYSARRLSRQTASGKLVRVRRGLYLPASVWESMKPWEQDRMRIQAVDVLASRHPIFARESAALVMGLPLIQTPRQVQTVVAPGLRGGQSSKGVHRTSSVEGDPVPWTMFGLKVTPPVETARDLALRLPLSQSLPAMDKLMQREILPGSPHHVNLIFTADHVRASAALLPNGTQRRRVERVLEVADGLSQSAGESWSRAIMIQHGFPRPVLQNSYYDDRGLIGYPDFEWKELKILGEFDGFEKYSAQRFLKGKTPSQVVVEEKRREDRLRALGYKVVRWVWADLQDPQRLIGLLHAAGLPSRKV